MSPMPWQARGLLALLLFFAVNDLPYGYYTFLRLVVFIGSALAAYAALSGSMQRTWVWAFGLIAITFNPVIPVHLSKEVWTVLDIAAGATFALSAYMGLMYDGPASKDGEGLPSMGRATRDLMGRGRKLND